MVWEKRTISSNFLAIFFFPPSFSPPLEAALRTVQKLATPALCTTSNQGECDCANSANPFQKNLQTYTYTPLK